MPEWSMPETMRLGRVGLQVADLEAVERFYREVVGLVVRDREDRVVRLGSDERTLLSLHHEPAASPRAPSAAGLYHTAFRVPSREALGAALHRIQARGQLSGASDHGVSEALYLSDPEGNGVEIYRDRPPSAWPSEDGNLVIPTDPLDLEDLGTAGTIADSVPAETDIGHVHLEVTDLDRARQFFTEALGLNLRYEYHGAAFLAAGSYHHHVAVNTWQGRTAPLSGTGLESVTMIVPEAAYEELCDHLGALASERVTVETSDEIPIRLVPDDDLSQET